MGVKGITYLRCPTKTLQNYVRDRRNHKANVRALAMRVESQADPLERQFYQAWLAEEKQDLPEAIGGLQGLRADTQPGTNPHLCQGDGNQARGMLDETMAQDRRDGSLGSGRQFAQFVRALVESKDRGEASAPR